MIRITGGQYRGRAIESPPRSREVRPTTSLMRESIFNQIQQIVPDCRFLDLFAGSGIMGLEALSRGASFVLALEAHKDQARMIHQNYAKIGIEDTRAKIVTLDVNKLISRKCQEEAFDIIFLDPPYGFKKLPELVEQCIANGWLKPGGRMIVEHGSREPDLPGFTGRKIYGDSSLSFYIALD